MKFIYNNPFFRILLAFIAGIILYVFAAQTLWVAITLIVCALVLLLPSVIVKNPSHQFTLRWTFGLGVIFFFTGIGFVLSKWESEQNTFSELNKRAVFLIELTDNPIQKAKSYKCKVQVLTCYTLRGPVSVNKNALIYLQKSENAALLKHGNRLLIQTTFKEAPGKINPEGFDYKHYLQLQGIGAMAYADSLHWRKMAYTPQFSIMQMASGAQKSLVDIYARYGISGNEYAVLSALTLGYTDELQPEIMAGYSASGAMHILSVSGLHVGIVYMVISFLLSFIPKNRFLIIVKAVFIVIFLWLYAFTTGLSPSVIRSAAMFSFVAIGSAFNRKSQIFNTIFASAFLILLTNPLLLFNVGFQLSYTAVISIIIFQPTFSALLPTKNKPLKWVRDLFAVSIAAQIGTLPLTLYYFQQFPNYFLLTNLLAIPLSGLIIYVAMFLQATAVIPFIATITAQILKYLLFALNYCINFIYKLPNSVTIISLDIIQSILFIVGTSLIVSYVIRKKANYLIAGLLSFLIIIIIAITDIYKTKNSSQFIVYAASKGYHINCIENGRNFVISNNITETAKIAGVFWRKNYIDTPVQINTGNWISDNYIYFLKKRITICKPVHWQKTSRHTQLMTDILVVGNKSKPKTKQLFNNIQPKLVVVDASISEWYTENIRNECIKRHIEFYSIAEKGAFILKD